MNESEVVAVSIRSALIFIGLVALGAFLYGAFAGPSAPQVSSTATSPAPTGATGGDGDEIELGAESETPDQSIGGTEVTLAQAQTAIDLYDPQFFERLRNNPRCRDCDEIFAVLRERFESTSDPVLIGAIAEAFAQSDRPELVSELIAKYRAAEGDLNTRSQLIDALQLVTGNEEVANVLAPLLATGEDQDLQGAALAGLSGLNDSVAAAALLDYARARADGKGGYDVAAGLGEFIPNEETVPLLERVVREGSAESPLAIRALLNGGVDSTKRAFEILNGLDNEAEQQRLLAGAQSHVLLEPATLDYLQTLLRSGQGLTPAVRSFLVEALARDGRELEGKEQGDRTQSE